MTRTEAQKKFAEKITEAGRTASAFSPAHVLADALNAKEITSAEAQDVIASQLDAKRSAEITEAENNPSFAFETGQLVIWTMRKGWSVYG